ncbi:MAG: hypothetical protein RIC35_18380 [Marinoscillum sp.]
MKTLFYLLLAVAIAGCTSSTNTSAIPYIQRTWLLLNATTIQGNDTSFTDYTANQKFIKIINATHFSFLKHDLEKGLDSTNNVFTAGAGSYTLKGTTYTENLEFCNYRPFEGHVFEFELTLIGDTLIQQGREKVEELGVDRIIIEKYVALEK